MASYRDVAVADIQRSLLEAVGIPAVVRDEHTVALAWTYAQGTGGISVLVPPDRLSEARQLLRTDASDDLDDLPESSARPDTDSLGREAATVPVAIGSAESTPESSRETCSRRPQSS